MTRPAASMRWDRRTISLAAMAIGLCAVTAATQALQWRVGGWALIGGFALGTVCALTAGHIAAKADERMALATILVGAAAMRLALLARW